MRIVWVFTVSLDHLLIVPIRALNHGLWKFHQQRIIEYDQSCPLKEWACVYIRSTFCLRQKRGQEDREMMWARPF